MSRPSRERDPQRKSIAVLGGGISGLTAAHRLLEISPGSHVTLFEASDRCGGVLETLTRDGYLIEQSGDSFITHPDSALNLCRRLGLESDLLPTASTGRRALLVHDGKLKPVPPGFIVVGPRQIGPMLWTDVLSWRGKMRLLEELAIPVRSPYLADESVADFARRRFGSEVYDRIIQPLVGSIYTADPERLSMRAALPRFWDAELQCGSLIAAGRDGLLDPPGSRANDHSSGARYGMFVSLRRGMAQLVEAIQHALPAGTVKTRHTVERLAHDNAHWQVTINGPNGKSVEEFDALVLATPGPVSARLLRDVAPDLSERLTKIEYAGAAIVCLGIHRRHIAHPLDAFGFVVPLVENLNIIAGSFSSVKFPGRAPADHVLLRAFVGGALQPEQMRADDRELTQLVLRDLRQLIGLRGEPSLIHIRRWQNAMPQYHVGHAQLVDEIANSARRLPDFELIGNAFRGVGITQCVVESEAAAERLCRT